MKTAWLLGLLVGALVACSHPSAPDDHPRPSPPPAPGAVTISIIGTNDVHGALERLPMFGGFVANLRAARAADGGGVVLVDGGDMFQGTLESNLAEGADVVRAYNALGYAAAAVGNHEFDYGPEGPAASATSADQDPRGALKARAREAKFPFVVSNILDAATGNRIDWPNMPASTLVTVAGVKIGIVGASTESTPHTTLAANFAGLKMAAPAPAIAEQATALRAQGAQIIIATMHIGSNCKDVSNPSDTSSCDKSEELFRLVDQLPKGTVDVIVGGHTHAGVAHRINDIAVIESYSSGRAFGRIDLRVGSDGKLTAVTIEKPHPICEGDKASAPLPIARCVPGSYEGKPVTPDADVQKIVDDALARASERRNEKLGVVLTGQITPGHETESSEGNWFCDLMLAARPDAQVAVTNGGGLRATVPAGELTYGQLYQANPFDNRFAIIDVTGKDLRTLVTGNLQHGGAIMSWGGLTATARCKGDQLDVKIKVAGKPLDEAGHYKLVTSDFLASGGNGFDKALHAAPEAIHITDTIIRDGMADVLRSWKGTPRASIDPAKLYAPTAPRLDYQGKRPVTCGAPPAASKEPEE